MIEFKHILCPIDFSDASRRALGWAAAFARSHGAALDVLHVATPVMAVDPAGAPGAMIEPLPAEALDGLTDLARQWIREAGPAGPNPTAETVEGRPHLVIADRAKGTDLLVMGTHGRSGFSRLVLGSVTEKVLHSVTCPVLTVPAAVSPRAAAAPTFRRILCAVDHSPSSVKAFDCALELARREGGRVTALYALEYLDPEEPCEHVDVDIRSHRQHFIEHARERLHARVAGRPAGSPAVEELVVLNRAYRAILEQARTMDADLIVMGAQGTSGLELMVYGSNTQRVIRTAECPVLTVHA